MSELTKPYLKEIAKSGSPSYLNAKLMANEILMLRELHAERQTDYNKAAEEITRLQSEIERLREALQTIIDAPAIEEHFCLLNAIDIAEEALKDKP